jgi:hypothetical protein
MEYWKVQNWDKWQTYRADRGQPPWIKVHRRLMRNPEWIALSDVERGQLVAIWLLAADRDGAIPASAELIQKICYMDSTPNIAKYVELGFISTNGVKAASSRRQGDQPEAKAKAKAEKKKPMAKFDPFWTAYPLKVKKQAALKSWKKIKPTPEILQTILTAIENQKQEHEEFRKAGEWHPEWPHPSTWLNNARWEDEIRSPNQEQKDAFQRLREELADDPDVVQ